VSCFTLRIIITLMETIKELYISERCRARAEECRTLADCFTESESALGEISPMVEFAANARDRPSVTFMPTGIFVAKARKSAFGEIYNNCCVCREGQDRRSKAALGGSTLPQQCRDPPPLPGLAFMNAPRVAW